MDLLLACKYNDLQGFGQAMKNPKGRTRQSPPVPVLSSVKTPPSMSTSPSAFNPEQAVPGHSTG
jgi:hypothetical protein